MSGTLVVAEHVNGALRDITAEMIGVAVALKPDLGGPVTVALLGQGTGAIADALNLEGVDEIVTVDTPGPDFDPAVYEEIICQLGQERRPELVLFGHTANGMGCASGLAARLGAGFASDVLALSVEDGKVIATRSVYGNKLNMDLDFGEKRVVILTLRGATFAPPGAAGKATRTVFPVDLSGLSLTESLSYEEAPVADFDLAKAEFIMSVGRGIQNEENLPRFQALAERIGATLGCSRPIVDAGWLPKARQVGQSGTVAQNCKFYIALGISGAVQHQYGMKHVDTIIAINSDAEAPIFNVATYGVSMDLFEFADALEAAFPT